MPLAARPADVAAAFEQLDRRDNVTLQHFCNRWLLPAGSDLLPAAAPGLAAGPPPGWLPQVQNAEARTWAEALFSLWGALCRQATPDVAAHPERHSLLQPAAQGRPFVVPGARFREQYYWDTFWSLRGLLVCGLHDLAKDVLCTMLAAVEQFGFTPNGLRSYYLNRSQPPLLSQTVAAVHASAPDLALLARALAALQREHAYWTSSPKAVELQGPDGRTHRLSRYWAATDQPRPEAYREDVATAAGLDGAAAAALWRELASAAESGWDFSSRWLDDGVSLRSCRTTRVVPADLNALLYQMECNIASFAAELGEDEVAARFRAAAAARLQAIDALLWDERGGQWRDLVLAADASGGSTGSSSFEQSSVVVASNWVPLYCGCAPAGTARAAAALAGLRRSNLLAAAGVAVTLRETGQQWDWPNSWPPLTCMLLEGCASYCGQEGKQLAAALADQYLRSAYAAWAACGRMFEKFDAQQAGAPGGGGEYQCVDGFGWTNGVALLLLERYGWDPAAGAAAGLGSPPAATQP
ncbi:putative trehalase [Micractinium conductrix]|uniref:Trehalase n=1 Tax=Micractinium conductrix TaxID=554055 RepID=A0A2P6VLJ5_9CHLO|nr:putative trehalase [Micractinium conductrix]|eukprot:PSC74959.1 putative trehalase [Micractinium conductrix]